MLKRPITYEDFDGNTVTDIFYFNLSQAELVEMEFSKEEGFGEMLKRIVEMKDNRNLIGEFKKLILMSYGEKSADGKRFIKNEDLRDTFSQTAAYSALFMELATQDEAATVFIKGVLPQNMSLGLQNAVDSPALPPPSSVS